MPTVNGGCAARRDAQIILRAANGVDARRRWIATEADHEHGGVPLAAARDAGGFYRAPEVEEQRLLGARVIAEVSAREGFARQQAW